MQQQGDQPVCLDYSRPSKKRWRPFVHIPTVLFTTIAVAPLHFGAVLVFGFLGYSCCSSNGSTTANVVANVLAFPALHLASLMNLDQTGGFVLMAFNSAIWGIVIGTGLSFLLGRPSEAAA